MYHKDEERDGFTPRDVLRLTLLKCACGYASGHTAKVIVEELGLVKNWKLTAKGKLYLWNCFETNNF